MPANNVEDHDILIIGAGISGINAAHLLRLRMPHRSFTVLEARHRIGGTWNFFRFPGFRSDSSMSSFGFQWHTWPHASKVGSAEQIAAYLESAVDAEPGLRERVRLDHRVSALEWDSGRARWRLEVDAGGKRVLMDAKFVIGCTGYYDYQKPLEADIPGLGSFQGEVVHTQFWPDALDVSSKRIAIIGSGATTITILPELVKTAAHVTQVQRSPSYVASIPTISRFEEFLKLFLPSSWVHWLGWWFNTVFELFLTEFVLAFPKVARFALRKDIKAMLPEDVDVDVHFNPKYAPMTQRLCLTPDGEYFDALKRDNCEIVTDEIKTVVKDGIILQSGHKVDADIIVTATGLRLHLLGGLIPKVDGKPIYSGEKFAWRGSMLTDLPNMAFVIGYVTSTWTPGSDLMSKIVIKLLTHMEKRGADIAVPHISEEEAQAGEKKLAVDLTANYIVKAADRVPKVTGKGVWYGRTHLARDTWAMLFGDMDEGMVFSGPGIKDTKKVK
jgi:cation diffusion facilitator CzcD-associated flavoprotein CzcO